MQPKPIVPPALLAGSRVALVAPSGPVPGAPAHLEAITNCRALGFEPVIMPASGNRWGYFAGTDEERLGDLNRALTDPDIDAVWCLRGGSGMGRIVDQVEFDTFSQRPKVVLGYSDITVLLHALWTRTGVVTFHGPVARTSLPAFAQAQVARLITDPTPAGTLPFDPSDASPVVTVTGGVARGRLFGGNLSLMQTLIGTPYFPDLRGAILMLEDVSEAVYRVDRMLAQLRMAGALAQLAGVILGRFTEVPPSAGDDEFGLAGLWQQYFGGLGIPVAAGFPIGHIDSQWTLPIGATVELDATRGLLTLPEAAVHS